MQCKADEFTKNLWITFNVCECTVHLAKRNINELSCEKISQQTCQRVLYTYFEVRLK